MTWRLPKRVQLPSPCVPEALRRFRLSPRLLALAQRVPEGAALVDVGTDHGLIPIALMSSARVRRAIGVDRAEPPLRIARRNRARFKTPSVELRRGEGLFSLSRGEADTALIAGMGGKRIVKILERPSPVELGIERLVLQPNTQGTLLRGALNALGWAIIEEALVPDERRLFLVIEAIRGQQTLSFEEQVLGPRLRARSGPIYRALVEERLHLLEKHALHQAKHPRPATLHEIRVLRRELLRMTKGQPLGLQNKR